jgi:hypothetical protein
MRRALLLLASAVSSLAPQAEAADRAISPVESRRDHTINPLLATVR